MDLRRNFSWGGTAIAGGGIDPNWTGNPQITSPVAYMTSVPFDVFYVVGNNQNEPERRQFMWVNWPYAHARTIIPDASLATVMRQYGAWRMTSAGPDLSRGQITGDTFLTVYDATNGTVSLGQIHRTAISPDGNIVP